MNSWQTILNRKDLVPIYMPLALATLLTLLMVIQAVRLRPMLNARAELLKAVTTAEEQLQAIQESRQPDVLMKRIALARADRQQQASRFISSDEIASVLDNVRTLANNQGVNLTGIQALPRGAAGSAAVYERYGFQVVLEGPLPGILRVIGLIPEPKKPVIRISRMTITPLAEAAGRYTATVDIYIYAVPAAQNASHNGDSP